MALVSSRTFWSGLGGVCLFLVLVGWAGADIAPYPVVPQPTQQPTPLPTAPPGPPAPTPPDAVTQAASNLAAWRAALYQAEMYYTIVYYYRSWDPWEVMSYYWYYMYVYQEYQLAYFQWQQAVNGNTAGSTLISQPAPPSSPVDLTTPVGAQPAAAPVSTSGNPSSGQPVAVPSQNQGLDNPFGH